MWLTDWIPVRFIHFPRNLAWDPSAAMGRKPLIRAILETDFCGSFSTYRFILFRFIGLEGVCFLEEVDVCFPDGGCEYRRRSWICLGGRLVDVRKDASTWFDSGPRRCRTVARRVDCLENLGRSAGLGATGS